MPTRCSTVFAQNTPIGADAPPVLIVEVAKRALWEDTNRTAGRVGNVCTAIGQPWILYLPSPRPGADHPEPGPSTDALWDTLYRLAAKHSCLLMTDVHDTHGCADLANVADVLRIDASHDPSLLRAAAQTGCVLALAAQSPSEAAHACALFLEEGNAQIVLVIHPDHLHMPWDSLEWPLLAQGGQWDARAPHGTVVGLPPMPTAETVAQALAGARSTSSIKSGL